MDLVEVEESRGGQPAGRNVGSKPAAMVGGGGLAGARSSCELGQEGEEMEAGSEREGKGGGEGEGAVKAGGRSVVGVGRLASCGARLLKKTGAWRLTGGVPRAPPDPMRISFELK